MFEGLLAYAICIVVVVLYYVWTDGFWFFQMLWPAKVGWSLSVVWLLMSRLSMISFCASMSLKNSLLTRLEEEADGEVLSRMPPWPLFLFLNRGLTSDLVNLFTDLAIPLKNLLQRDPSSMRSQWGCSFKDGDISFSSSLFFKCLFNLA